MSLSLLTIPTLPFDGAPFTIGTNLGRKSAMEPTAIPLLINWIIYGAGTAKPNLGVAVDMYAFAQSTNKLLDMITSVYIDNTQSNVPIYIFFPSTNYTVTCPPNAGGWFPVHSNDGRANIYGRGFVTGQVPQTVVIFSNVYIPPFIDYEVNQAIQLQKASPIIQRGNTIYNSDYGVPALGDQIQQVALDTLPITPQTAVLWQSPRTSGYIYLTSVAFSLEGVFSPVVPYTTLTIESLTSGALFSFTYGNNSALGRNETIYQNDNMQLKLDATQTWQVRNSPNQQRAGVINVITVFTFNPNLL